MTDVAINFFHCPLSNVTWALSCDFSRSIVAKSFRLVLNLPNGFSNSSPSFRYLFNDLSILTYFLVRNVCYYLCLFKVFSVEGGDNDNVNCRFIYYLRFVVTFKLKARFNIIQCSISNRINDLRPTSS